MINRTDAIFNDSRSNLRVKENRRIYWRTSNQKGQGRIKNISATGMLIETNAATLPPEQTVFSFDSMLGPDNFIPQVGRLVWRKRKGVSQKYLCGVRFVEPAEYVLSKLRKRIQKGIIALSRRKKWDKLANNGMFVAVAGLVVYITWQGITVYDNLKQSNQLMIESNQQQALLTQSYAFRLDAANLEIESLQSELLTTKALYQESESMLGGVRQELDETREVLAETDALLKQAEENRTALTLQIAGLEEQIAAMQNQRVNMQGRMGDFQTTVAAQMNNNVQQKKEIEAQITALQADIDNLQGSKDENESTIRLLQEKNLQLEKEMKDIEGQLAYLSGEVSNVEEGKTLVNLYKANIKNVRKKIKYFREQAHDVRVAAMRERDRIKLLLGNNGYLVKDGQSVEVDFEKYQNAQLDGGESQASDISLGDSQASKVSINVDFVD